MICIIDIKGIGIQNGLLIRNLKTSASNSNIPEKPGVISTRSSNSDLYETMTVSFDVSASYEAFIGLLKSIESSLRILDISSISVSSNETNTYDFKVELKTYWLKQ